MYVIAQMEKKRPISTGFKLKSVKRSAKIGSMKPIAKYVNEAERAASVYRGFLKSFHRVT